MSPTRPDRHVSPDDSADRSLLVGILALQLDFVTRDQLIAATMQWSRRKGTPLLEFLASEAGLTAAECASLATLVELHEARHGHNAMQSLMSLQASDAATALLAATDDADVHRTLAFLCETGHDPHATLAPPSGKPASSQPSGGKPSGEKPIARTPSAPKPPPSPGREADRPTSHVAGDTLPLRGPGGTPAVDAKGRSDAQQTAKTASDVPLSMAATQRYQVIKPFQRGGLGQVSLARDDELNREVALKEILPRHADSQEARQRFLVEAEITGSLEHPGVVPVYGLGQYGDGRPFYAMRFIRGDNLQLAIEEFHRDVGHADRELRFRQLLGRFVDVCNAMEYAHNRSVIHRDLKPSNIMLGRYGETLVVDWGLAKTTRAKNTASDTIEMPIRPASADSSTETQMGRVVGTPAYMSPEQASGRLDLLGPATDIYSLGATLYHLLCGAPPFGGEDPEGLIGNVQLGLFTPPRQRKSDVPRPLEAICLKAMAREPAQRYHAAAALGEDVERYLADEPVRAYREPLLQRIGRWMRNHRALVYSAAAMLGVTAVALTLGVLLLGAANRREMAQRQLAERNFEMARSAVRDYYISVSEDTLLNQEGMQPLRDELLRQALAYYQKFLESEPDEPALQEELAQANFYVGSITEKLESPAAAMPYLQQARTIYDRLTKADPSKASRWESFGRALNAIGAAHYNMDQLDSALQDYQHAETVRQRLVDRDPSNVEFVRTLANTVMNQGIVWAKRGNRDEVLKLWHRAQSLRTKHLRPGDPDHLLLQQDLAKGDFNLGRYLSEQEDYGAAESHLREAVKTFEGVVKSQPNDIESQFLLALAYRTLGDLPIDGKSLDDSLAYFERAATLLGTLSVRNPEVPRYREQLGTLQLFVADRLLQAERKVEAREAIGRALPVLQELAGHYPDQELYQRDLAEALRISGSLAWELAASPEEKGSGRKQIEDAIARWEALFQSKPTDDDYREQLELTRQALEEAKP